MNSLMHIIIESEGTNRTKKHISLVTISVQDINQKCPCATTSVFVALQMFAVVNRVCTNEVGEDLTS